jgi:hypothetical protein
MDQLDAENNQQAGGPGLTPLQQILMQLSEMREEQVRNHAATEVLRNQNEELYKQVTALAKKQRRTPSPALGLAPPATEASAYSLNDATTPPAAPFVPIPAYTQHTIRRKPLPVGEPFAGNKAYFGAWRVTMEHKLEVDQEFIGNHKAQFIYLYSMLSPAVQREVAPFYEVGGYDNWNPNKFLDHLSFCYSDTHGKERAQVRLDQLRQGKKQPFMDFFIAFNQTLAQAGGLAWSGEHKLTRLRQALNNRMREVSMNRGVSRMDYDSAVLGYKLVAVDIETAEMEHVWRENAAPPPAQQLLKKDRDGDTPMIHVGATNTGSPHPRGRPAPTWDGYIPQKVFDERKAAGTCTRCGGPGHYARNCPHAAVLHTVSVLAAGVGHQEDRSGN